jgi:hypothetical protein
MAEEPPVTHQFVEGQRYENSRGRKLEILAVDWVHRPGSETNDGFDVIAYKYDGSLTSHIRPATVETEGWKRI